MLAAYIDESARDDDFYFMGALIVDDISVVRIESGLNRIARMIAASVPEFEPGSEFHGYDIFHGKGAWAAVPSGWRVKACTLVSKVLSGSGARYLLRGIDVDALRARYKRPYPPHELCVAQVLTSINEILEKEDPLGTQALVLADEHHTAPSSRRNLRTFKLGRVAGYTNRRCERIADTLYFGPSHESRLLQAADVATFFMNRAMTMEESDMRSTVAIAEIVRLVKSITHFDYVWKP